MKQWTWTDAVYDVSDVLLQGPGDEAAAYIKATFDDDMPDQRWTGAKTCWIEDDAKGCALVIWLPEWWDADKTEHLSVLAHETQHGAVRTLTSRGCVYTPESEEAFTYHTAWLFRECLSRLRGERVRFAAPLDLEAARALLLEVAVDFERHSHDLAVEDVNENGKAAGVAWGREAEALRLVLAAAPVRRDPEETP